MYFTDNDMERTSQSVLSIFLHHIFLITCQIAATFTPASPSLDPLPSLSQRLLLLLTQVKGVEPFEDASPEPLLH